MLGIFFRILRKLGGFYEYLQKRLLLCKWHALYAGRFTTSRNLGWGKLFGLYFDASLSRVRIGSAVQFRDYCQVRSGMNGTLMIGNRVFFNNHCSITCFHSIVIGDDCQFGEGVKFYDHNHQYRATDIPSNQQGYSIGSIKIGNNCWMGSNVVVLKNVEIGDNVVIGAGCIVHKSIPSNTVVIHKNEHIYTSR
jgi:acetyltransferase-like isoleucine patch superfamily enzyme